MKDLNILLKKAKKPETPSYFEPGKYTCKVLSIEYVERDDKDDVIFFKFLIEDAFPGSKLETYTQALWGKKVTESNMLDIDKFVSEIVTGPVDLNSIIDTENNESILKNQRVYVIVEQTTWNGKPFNAVTFKRFNEEQVKKIGSWPGYHGTTPLVEYDEKF